MSILVSPVGFKNYHRAPNFSMYYHSDLSSHEFAPTSRTAQKSNTVKLMLKAMVGAVLAVFAFFGGKNILTKMTKV